MPPPAPLTFSSLRTRPLMTIMGAQLDTEPVEPLICPKCQEEMRIVAFIEDDAVIKKILEHLGLWDTRSQGPPVQNTTHIQKLTYDDDYSQIPAVDYWLQ